MRTSILSLFLLFFGGSVVAQATADMLRNYAYAGDYIALEAALADGHQKSLRGEISFDDVRDMIITLTVTHPTIIETTDTWLEALPRSPYANALRAFQYSSIGWQIRGGASVRNTSHMALQAFRTYLEAGMDHAQIAYAEGPDFAPASDAIFRLQVPTKRLRRNDYFQVVEHAMTVTPSVGTLMRAAGIANRNWGGVGQRDIFLLCNQYAERVPDVEGYTHEVCLTHLTYNVSGASNAEEQFAWEQLGDQYQPILGAAFILKITSVDGRQELTPEELRRLEEYYMASETGWNGTLVAGKVSNSSEIVKVIEGAIDRGWDHFVAEIPHNPFYKRYLEAFLEGRPFIGSTTVDPTDLLTDESRLIAYLRLAYFEPHNHRHWYNAAEKLRDLEIDGRDQDIEGLVINAIHFSGHSRASIARAMSAKWRSYQAAMNENSDIHSDEEIRKQWLCPLTRLNRLLELQCAQDGDTGQACLSPNPVFHSDDALLRRVRENGFCNAESTGTFSELSFNAPAYRLEMEELLTPLQFRTSWND